MKAWKEKPPWNDILIVILCILVLLGAYIFLPQKEAVELITGSLLVFGVRCLLGANKKRR